MVPESVSVKRDLKPYLFIYRYLKLLFPQWLKRDYDAKILQTATSYYNIQIYDVGNVLILKAIVGLLFWWIWINFHWSFEKCSILIPDWYQKTTSNLFRITLKGTLEV